MSVLLVDDDRRNLESLTAVLAPLGRTIVAATSGHEALRHCLEHDFAVIILDVRMPGLDGYQTAEIIRSRERSAATPIIFLTATDHSDLGEMRGYETGAVDYLQKPAEPHVLRSKVRVFLELHERARRLREQEQRVRELEAREHARALEETERRERERADQAIRQVLERQALVLQSVPMVVFTSEASEPYRTTWISDNVERVMGYPPDALLADPAIWPSRVPPEDLARLRGELVSAADGRWHSCEYRWLLPDGTPRWFLSQFHVAPGERGDDMLTGTALDITDHHRTREALAETDRRFHHAQKMEAVGRLAGAVAHDFNNLLSVVLGYGQFVAESLAPDNPARADVQQILEVGERAAALTRQLLAFSRQQVLAPRVLDLNLIVEGLRTLLRPLAGEQIELAIATCSAPATVRIDPGQIEQVIMNLAVNARDAMPSGGQLRVETSTLTVGPGAEAPLDGLPPGSYVVLSVADTGCGMDQATLTRIFEPFFTTKEAGKGTGLGLATVYGIIEQSGGRIHVDSAVGRGTTFRVVLPLAGERPGPAAERPQPAATRRGSETILLAEDEPNLREILRGALGRLGCNALAAGDGRAALDVAARHQGPIDLLLTDVVMPAMGGQELATRLSAERPGLKVLFMSGYTDRGITDADLAPAGRAFVQKPFTPDTLAELVRRLLNRR